MEPKCCKSKLTREHLCTAVTLVTIPTNMLSVAVAVVSSISLELNIMIDAYDVANRKTDIRLGFSPVNHFNLAIYVSILRPIIKRTEAFISESQHHWEGDAPLHHNPPILYSISRTLQLSFVFIIFLPGLNFSPSIFHSLSSLQFPKAECHRKGSNTPKL